MTGSRELTNLDHVAIAQLDPSLDGVERVVEGVVTLIWPFSASNKSFSILLAEADVRLRRQKGQVRIHFTGSIASAVSRCDPKSGDHITLHLLGAQWEKDETVSKTPGRGIDWQLRFEQRLTIQIRRENQEPIHLNIDHPISSPEPQVHSPSPPGTPPTLQFPYAPLLSSTAPSRLQAWSTPAFLKRDRLSTATFFGSDYDPFNEDEFQDNSRRKKTKFGRGSDQWRFTERSSSPESTPKAGSPVVQQPTVTESQNGLVNGHHDTSVQQELHSVDRETYFTPAGGHAAGPKIPPDLDLVADDRLAGRTSLSTSEIQDLSSPPIVSKGTESNTVDEGVQTSRRGSESPDPHHEVQAMGGQDLADKVAVKLAPDLDYTDMTAGFISPQLTTSDKSPTAKIIHDVQSPLDTRDINKISDGNAPNSNSEAVTEPPDESRMGPVSTAPGMKSSDESVDVKQVLLGGLPDTEPPAYEVPQVEEQAVKATSHHEIPNVISHLDKDRATVEIIEEKEEIQETIDQVSSSLSSIKNQTHGSNAPKLAKEAKARERARDQVSPFTREFSDFANHVLLDMKADDVERYRVVQDHEPEDMSTLQEPLATLPKQEAFPKKVHSIKSSESPQPQPEVVETIVEDEESDSRSERDNVVDDGPDGLSEGMPGKAKIMQEDWDSEGSWAKSSYGNPEIEESDDEDDFEGFGGQAVEVISLDDSDDDNAFVARSQTDGAAISILTETRRFSQATSNSSAFKDGKPTFRPSPPLLPSTIQDSQPSPTSPELESSDEDVSLQPDEDRSSLQALESTRHQRLPEDLSVNNRESSAGLRWRSASPIEELSVEDHIDPRLKNKVLTPNDTQPQKKLSQVSDLSLRSIHDTHDLPTPQLTQNRSSDDLLPASLRPSSPVIPSSSPPASSAKSSPIHRYDETSSLVDQLRKLRNEARVSPKQSPKSRRVPKIPVSISPWFAPKRSSGIVRATPSEGESENGESGATSNDDEQTEIVDDEEEIPSSMLEPPSERRITRRIFQRTSTPLREPLPSSTSSPQTGLRTSHAYYATLSTLSSHFNTTTSTLAIVLAATPIARATSGPRDFYTTIFIADPSSLPSTSNKEKLNSQSTPSATGATDPYFTTTSIFRPSRSSLPNPLHQGSVLLLRSFTITSTNRTPSLLSTNTSAWAIFTPHNPGPIISGPPVEFGAEERGYVRGLWEWWDQLDPTVKKDAVQAAEEKVRKAVEKEEREKRKGRRLKGMGLRLAPGGKGEGTGRHELRGGKEWKDEVQSPKGKGKGRRAEVRHELRDGKEWVDEKYMPTKTFPITKSFRNHVDPTKIPLTILVAFRTDIWTHPKRDAIPTPPMSPHTTALDEREKQVGGESVARAVKRLREICGVGENEEAMEGEMVDERLEQQKESSDESEESCFCGLKLGLRGGDGGLGRDWEGALVDGEGEGRGDRYVESEERGLKRRGGNDGRYLKALPVLKRQERSRNLRALKQRYDPDAESIYSRSTGTLGNGSRPELLMDTARASHREKPQRTVVCKEQPRQIDVEWLAHGDMAAQGATKVAGKNHCLNASHVWERRGLWAVPDRYGTLVKCDGCNAKTPKKSLWSCGLKTFYPSYAFHKSKKDKIGSVFAFGLHAQPAPSIKCRSVGNTRLSLSDYRIAMISSPPETEYKRKNYRSPWPRVSIELAFNIQCPVFQVVTASWEACLVAALVMTVLEAGYPYSRPTHRNRQSLENSIQADDDLSWWSAEKGKRRQFGEDRAKMELAPKRQSLLLKLSDLQRNLLNFESQSTKPHHPFNLDSLDQQDLKFSACPIARLPLFKRRIPEGSRTFSANRRSGGESTSGGKTPLNGITPLTTTNVTSPATGASSAFGLGSGAFASFGASTKTPKTPGTASEAMGKEREKDLARDTATSDLQPKISVSSLNSKSTTASEHSLRYTWIVWYRPPTSKFQDYEKSTIPLAHFSSVESFWNVYTHLKRPSTLPSVSDYHLFRKGIRPVWEDEENKRGGKWIVRLKKGVADRYWEDLLLAIVGDQFAEAGEEVCGAVLSVRSGEDVLSVWTRNDGGRNIKIRETIKRVLAFPPDTNIVWKSHDDSIAQRSAIDQARQEKGVSGTNHHTTGKRRQTMSEDSASEKAKG
ncbi:MAG: hypothetical protein Q9170_006383 [Blastenia crenularia]